MGLAKKHFGLILIVFLSLFSILPLLSNGFFPVHDDTQVARVFEMGKALKDGVFPVRWVPDLGYGYGYPIFNFYAPLSYYFGGFLNVLGFDALVSTKIMMVLGIIMAGVFMYLLACEFWGEIGGILSGLFYLYAPYHAVDIYVRGDVAEFWAYAFIPLMFYGFYKVYKSVNDAADLGQNNSKFKIQNVWKWIVVGSIGFAGVILSHNLTAMMVTPFLLFILVISFYLGLRKKQLSIFNFQLSILILGILLSSFYWLPVFAEMKFTNVLTQIGGGADFRDHFVCINQLWNSQWGFGGSTRGCIDGMSFKMGKLHVLLSLISLTLLFITILKNKLFIRFSGKTIVVILSFLGLVISIFLTLDLSKPIWELIPLMSFFQYPWRFLILASFFTSFLVGSVIWLLQLVIARRDVPDSVRPDEAIYVKERSLPPDQVRGRNDGRRVIYIISAVLLFLLIFFNAKLFNPQTIISKTAADYTSDYALKWVASKISDEYLSKSIKKPEVIDEGSWVPIMPVNNSLVKIVEKKTQKIVAEIISDERSYIRVNIAHFPAWKFYINGTAQTPEISKRGYVLIVDKGKHIITASFEETPIEKIANILSISGLAVLIIGIIYFRKFNFKQ